MSAEAAITQDQPEHISYSNVRIQLVVGRHGVSNEREYAESKNRIEDLGLHFFKRGFNNLLFFEEASGELNHRMERINDAAKQHRSFRTAYWIVIRGFDDADAKKLTMLFDQNPMRRLIQLGKARGFTDTQIKMDAFLYGQFAAADNIARKGYSITLLAEKPSDVRRQHRSVIEYIDVHSVSRWRETARLSYESDVELASQLEQIVSQNPQRTRLMALVGEAHMPIRVNLPPNLRHLCGVVKLHTDILTGEVAVLLQDIQSGTLSDEQIAQRLKLIF